MRSRSTKCDNKLVKWIGDPIRPRARDRREESRKFYKAFEYGKLQGKVGDYVLIHNYDSLDADTVEGCDIAKIVKLYEAAGNEEPFRAVVQWYTRTHQLPKKFSTLKMPFPQFDQNNEVIEDRRNFDNDINLETIFKICQVIQAMPEEEPKVVLSNYASDTIPSFVVRFQLNGSKRKQGIEILPNLEVEPNDMYVNIDGDGVDEISQSEKKYAPTTKGNIQRNKTSGISQEASTSSGESRLASKHKGNCDLKDTKKTEKANKMLTEDKSQKVGSSNASKAAKRKLEMDYDNLKDIKTKRESILNLKDKDISGLLEEESCSDSDGTSEDEESVPEKVEKKDSSLIVSEISDLRVKLARIPVKRTGKDKITEKLSISRSHTKDETHEKSRKSKLKADEREECFDVEKIADKTKGTQSQASPSSRLVRSKQVLSGSPLSKTTPKVHLKLKSEMTKRGSTECRKSKSAQSSALEEARARLHVSSIPNCLPCREQEFTSIYSFVEDKILDGAGGCMYICGVPGTGKTATVREVVRQLQEAASRGEIPAFEYGEVNGMKVTEPRRAYSEVLCVLTGREGVSPEEACELLDQRFSRPTPRRLPTLLLIDELDLLWTKRQDVVYNLMDWPNRDRSRLVLITIANTMDLPERILMGRVSSRLGLTRLTFHPYTFQQLQEIVMSRMKGLEAFDPDAVQLVARKVAAVSGDARRALDICRRATEIAESEGALGKCRNKSDLKSKQPNQVAKPIVTMVHVDQAISEMISSSKAKAIQSCSRFEKLFLQAVATEVERTGVEETSFERVQNVMTTLCTYNGLRRPTVTETMNICWSLGSLRLILTEASSRSDILQRIMLNVDVDSVHYALKVLH